MSRYFTKNWRTCISLGILMNTRGLVALIVLNVGLDQHILTPKIFAIFVIMALATTFMTGPLLRIAYQVCTHTVSFLHSCVHWQT